MVEANVWLSAWMLRHFLGFDGLVQAFGQTTTRHGTTGVFVDQYDLTVLHDVFDVAMEQLVRTQAGINVSQQAQVMRRVQAFAFGQQADLRSACLRRYW